MFRCEYRAEFTRLALESDGTVLTRVTFLDKNAAVLEKEDILPVFVQTAKWLDIYFSGKEPDFTPPYRLSGTDFQLRVWEKLTRIPYGKTAVYSELAAEIAKETGKSKMSAQAVGGAVGKNPIAIIVPCHRVIGKNGSLTGFAGGIEVKKRLLELEGG